MPTFAESSTLVPWNASVAMNSDMVNPMPPNQAHPWSAVQLTPSGSVASRNRAAAHAAAVIPSGLPTTSPKITARVTLLADDPLRPTPALENAKSGITTKADNP